MCLCLCLFPWIALHILKNHKIEIRESTVRTLHHLTCITVTPHIEPIDISASNRTYPIILVLGILTTYIFYQQSTTITSYEISQSNDQCHLSFLLGRSKFIFVMCYHLLILCVNINSINDVWEITNTTTKNQKSVCKLRSNWLSTFASICLVHQVTASIHSHHIHFTRLFCVFFSLIFLFFFIYVLNKSQFISINHHPDTVPPTEQAPYNIQRTTMDSAVTCQTTIVAIIA